MHPTPPPAPANWRKAMSLFVLVAVGATVCVPLYAFVRALTRDRSFSTERWRDHSVYETHYRLDMADDLIARKLLTGLSRDAVLKLLGPEETQRPFRDEHLVYYLGMQRTGFPIDSEWLAIRFDTAGIVNAYRIVED